MMRDIFLHYWTRVVGMVKTIYKRPEEQLDDWGVKYNDKTVFKPLYDVWIDDKGSSVRNDYEKDSDGNFRL